MDFVILVHGHKAKLKRPSLALLRCKMTFKFFELGLSVVQKGLAVLPCISVLQDFLIIKIGNFQPWSLESPQFLRQGIHFYYFESCGKI